MTLNYDTDRKTHMMTIANSHMLNDTRPQENQQCISMKIK